MRPRTVRVGHGGFGSAVAVADRSRIGAGAARSDLQQPTLVDPGYAAAARPEGGDVDAGHGNGDAKPDLELTQVALLAALDRADVGAGAPHIEGKGMIDACDVGIVASRDDSAGET